MAKVIKNRDEFVNENYYETSSTVVPGAGVNPGTFPGAMSSPEFFSVSDPRNKIEEKDVPQIGANGIANDPDYVPPSQYTHAKYDPLTIQLGDIAEDVNPDCKFYKSFGKVFAIQGEMVDYIIANEGDEYALGEVARMPKGHLKLKKKHQINTQN